MSNKIVMKKVMQDTMYCKIEKKDVAITTEIQWPLHNGNGKDMKIYTPFCKPGCNKIHNCPYTRVKHEYI